MAFTNAYVVQPGSTMRYGGELPMPSSTIGEISDRVRAEVYGALKEEGSADLSASEYLSRLAKLPCSPESKQRIANSPPPKPVHVAHTASSQTPAAAAEVLEQSTEGPKATTRCKVHITAEWPFGPRTTTLIPRCCGPAPVSPFLSCAASQAPRVEQSYASIFGGRALGEVEVGVPLEVTLPTPPPPLLHTAAPHR